MTEITVATALIALGGLASYLTFMVAFVSQYVFEHAARKAEPFSDKQKARNRKTITASWVTTLTFFPMALFNFMSGSAWWVVPLMFGVVFTVAQLDDAGLLPTFKLVPRGVELTTVGRLDPSQSWRRVRTRTVTFGRRVDDELATTTKG